MKLPEIAIRNSQFTLMIFIILLIMGVSSFLTMPRTEDPPMDIPGASVIAIYPGGNPTDLEELILNPIEKAVNELDDIKVITSTIKDGIVSMAVEFTFENDAQDKFDEVVRQVNSVRGDLPEDIFDLRILKWSSTDVVMLQLAFVSETAGLNRMNDNAERLKNQLEKINGIREVEVFAYPEKEVRISLDIPKMSVMRISVDDVANAIRSSNANIPGGQIRLNDNSFNVKTSGSYKNLDEIENTAVASYMGSLIYIKDIATVKFTNQDHNYKARLNGRPAIFLTVKQKEGLNIFHINQEIDPVLEEFRASLESEIEMHTVFSQVESVDVRVNGFFINLLQGIVLVGILVFLSLGFRASVLVIIAIPLSIFIGLGWLDIYGYGLQQISIAALVIALGLLVDNSIVVTENIERFIKSGKPGKQSAIEATSQLGWPVVTATLTTMLAFIPIITMPDKAGYFIQSLPITVILTLLASLFIALSLTPVLASGFLTAKMKNRTTPFRKLINSIIEGPYQKTLSFAITNRGFFLILAIVTLAGAGFLFREVGVSFFPKAEKPQFRIRIQLPEGSGIDQTDRVSLEIESILDTIPFVKSYASNIGHGNPRIYYNTFPRQFDKSYAEFFIQLEEYDVDRQDKLIASLRKYFEDFPAARVFIKEFEQGTPIEAPLTIKITGDNLEVLTGLSQQVHQFVENTAGVVNSENNLDKTSTDLWFRINRDKAGILGVPIHSIDMTLRTALAGSSISNFRDEEGKDYDIVLRLPVEDIPDFEDVKKIYVKSLTGEFIPISQLISIEFKEAPGIISHYNLFRDATITGDIEKGYSLDDIALSLQEEMERMNWPEGYHYKFTGELESREESFGGMSRASIIAVIAILALMILQFKSFRQAFIIFSAIPLSVIGSTLALYITGYSFSFTAFIGLISLIGIVINNSIILVDYTNILIREGNSIDKAIIEAGKTRFTPIILTSLTTIGGLLPLTLQGGTLWAPMGWTIIGGLLASTFLTLVIVPVLFSVFSKSDTKEMA